MIQRDRISEIKTITGASIGIAGFFLLCTFGAAILVSIGATWSYVMAAGCVVAPFIVLLHFGQERRHAQRLDIIQEDRQTHIAVAEAARTDAEARRMVAMIDVERERIDAQLTAAQLKNAGRPVLAISAPERKRDEWVSDGNTMRRTTVETEPTQTTRGGAYTTGDRLPAAATLRAFAVVLRDKTNPRVRHLQAAGMGGDVNEYTRAKAFLTEREFLKPTPERVGAEWNDGVADNADANADILEAFADELDARARA